MAFYADYRIIKDAQWTLKVGGSLLKQKSINLATTAAIGQSCILQWYYVGKAGSHLSYRWTINSVTIKTHHIIGNVYGTAHEVVGKGALKHGSNNFRVVLLPGSHGHTAVGSVKIGDVVLWFQRDAGGGPD